MQLAFVGSSNESRSVNISGQRSVNLVPEIDQHGKYPISLYGRPGLKTWAAGGAAEIRGLIELEGDLYAVVGSDLKKVTTGGAVSTIGTLNTATGRVGLAVNANATPQLIIVDGVNGYTTTGSSVTVISDSDFPDTATHVVYIDGYFVVNDPTNKGRFYISNSEDGTAWTATDYATAIRDPDKLSAIMVNHRELWLLGERSSEVWYNSGNPDFPFEPIESGFVEWGIAAPHSACRISGRIYWLAQGPDGDGIIMQSDGLQGVRISTHAVENAIAGYSKISDAFAYCLEMEGHIFYILTFPTGDATWVFDAASGLWAEWKSYTIGRFRGNAHAFFNGTHVIGDYQDGNLFQLSWTQFSDAGVPIERIRQDRHVLSQNLRERLFHRRLEIEFESGTGTASLDPQVMLQWSDDGGHTWSNEHWRGIGKVGKYANRARWGQLGQSRDRVYRITMTDDAKMVIGSGFLQADFGAQ